MTFQINGDYIELVRLLKASGLCQTGGEAKIRIENGEVVVDGSVETRKKAKIRPGQQLQLGETTLTVSS
jgi:ribosome-associated protein